MKTLGDHIRHFRERQGMSQQELAIKSGVSQATISDLESNKQESTRKLVEIADALNVSVEYLAPARKAKPQQEYLGLWEPPGTIESAQLDSCDIADAIAVAEGALLSAGLDPAYLEELHALLRECLAEPVISSTPQSAHESRRNITRSAVSRFLKQHAGRGGTE